MGIWSRPEGLIILRDMPPGWRVELCDWDGKVETEINLPGPRQRLEYMPREIIAAPNGQLYLSGEGEDFLHLQLWNGTFQPAISIRANEAMVLAWVQDALAYGGWSGQLCWKDQHYQFGEPIQALRSRPDTPWLLVRGREWHILQLESGQQRVLGPGAATPTPIGPAWAQDELYQQTWEGQLLSRQPLKSQVVSLEWLPRRHALVALHQDEVIRFYELGTGRPLGQLDLLGSLPVLPTRQSMPYNFTGRSSFHPDGRLCHLASSDGSESLTLSPEHNSGAASMSDGAVEQKFYANGTMEQFSAWDDGSPYPADFQRWALERVSRIWDN